MCGIIGYTGNQEAASVLLDGLKRLEYRGYDSAGVAVLSHSKIRMEKVSGKVEKLEERVREVNDLTGVCGIGHTRWATHGAPSDINAHPHMSQDGRFAVVHNGIIENYAQIRQELERKGVHFASETDTEVIVQLLGYYYDGNIKQTLMRTVSRLEGSYALGVLPQDEPGVLYAAKQSSPLIIGLGSGENFFASDITALISHTKNVIDLDDGEFARVTPDSVSIFDVCGRELKKEVRRIVWDIAAAEKSGYEHFMLKEIMEQPAALKATIDPRIKDGIVSFDELGLDISRYNRVIISACGSAYHAGFVGKNLIEKLCRIPVEAELASELRYRDTVMDENTLAIAISQSGETADTIAAIKECQRRGAEVLAIVNVVGSTIAKLADYVIYTWAGPEIAVATTKAFSAQLAAVYLLALRLSSAVGRIDEKEEKRHCDALLRLPEQIEQVLENEELFKPVAERFSKASSIFFIGRGLDYSISLEGSLKLKEISYIKSEAYAAGELKHGTISLIEPGTPVFAVATQPDLFEKTLGNIREVKSRGAYVAALVGEDCGNPEEFSDVAIKVPNTLPEYMPSLNVIPLQLIAYFTAVERGCDVDKPRNLAKSVTVE